MKLILVAAASLFLVAIPAHAQAPPSQLNFSGGGIGGPSNLAFSLPVTVRTQHDSYAYAQGSDATFVPTRFVSYTEALKLGIAAAAYRPKTILEVAAECRAAKMKTK